MASLVVPKAMYACSATPCGKRALQSLRAAAGRAIWGLSNSWRAPEILFTLLCKGHISDPLQVSAYLTFLTARRVMRRQPHLISKYLEVLNFHREHQYKQYEDRELGSLFSKGPVAAIMQACKVANWTLREDGLGAHHLLENDVLETGEIDLLEGDEKRFSHVLRASLRQEQWDRVSQRRPSFKHIEVGVDREASMLLYSKLPGLQRHRLRCLHAGAVASQVRLARNSRGAQSDLCLACGQKPETVEHIFAECEKYEPQRAVSMNAEYFHNLPMGIKTTGLLPQHFPIPEDCGPGLTGRQDLATRIQYTLLDILGERSKYLPQVPQPRWERQSRQRTR